MKFIKISAVILAALTALMASSSFDVREKKTAETDPYEEQTETAATDSEGGWFQSYGEYRYYTNGKEASIAAYLGKDTKLNLPSDCAGIPVVSLGWSAFSKNETLEEVIIPDTIRVIGVSAFAECTALKKITLSKSVTKLDINCFSGCSALADLTVTENVEEIGISAFSGCTSLSALKCDEKNAFYSAEDGVLYSKDKTSLKVYPAGKTDERYTVNESTLAISDRAFEGNGSIKSVNLKNVTDVGSYAFKDCTSLYEVKHDKDMTVAGGAFENTFYEAETKKSTPAEEEGKTTAAELAAALVGYINSDDAEGMIGLYHKDIRNSEKADQIKSDAASQIEFIKKRYYGRIDGEIIAEIYTETEPTYISNYECYTESTKEIIESRSGYYLRISSQKTDEDYTTIVF